MNPIIEQDCQEILRRVDLKKLAGKRILITGANGFLGQYLTSVLSYADKEMKLGLIIHATGLNEPKQLISDLLEVNKNIIYKKIDLTKPFETEKYDYIFHAAGYSQPAKFVAQFNETIAINIDATQRLLDTSPDATFVFFSSSEVYGDIPKERTPVTEDYNGNSPLHTPRSVYAESKRLGEALCAAYKRDRGSNIKIVRVSMTYGPSLPVDDKRVMSEFIRKALQEKEISLLDAGIAVRTYGYIADNISMILYAGIHGKEFVYNVAGADSVSIRELAEKISSMCGVSYKIPETVSSLKHVGGDPLIVNLDVSKIRNEMGAFKFLDFDEGLRRTIQWTKEQIK